MPDDSVRHESHRQSDERYYNKEFTEIKVDIAKLEADLKNAIIQIKELKRALNWTVAVIIGGVLISILRMVVKQ